MGTTTYGAPHDTPWLPVPIGIGRMLVGYDGRGRVALGSASVAILMGTVYVYYSEV